VREVDIASYLSSHFAENLACLEVAFGGLSTASKFSLFFELGFGLEFPLAKNTPWSFGSVSFTREYGRYLPMDIPLARHMGMISRSMSLTPRFHKPWLTCQSNLNKNFE
jgi:hypothetical protein